MEKCVTCQEEVGFPVWLFTDSEFTQAFCEPHALEYLQQRILAGDVIECTRCGDVIVEPAIEGRGFHQELVCAEDARLKSEAERREDQARQRERLEQDRAMWAREAHEREERYLS